MYVGLVSNLGVLLWCSCAAICLFSGAVICQGFSNRETCLFMVCSGLFTAMLLLDDLFMLHEEVFPDHLFIPQPLVFVAYGFITLAYLFRFRKTILATEYLLLILAVGFFAASVFVDLFVTPEEFLIAGYPGRHIIEDGLKLFGIVTWTAYLIRVCISPFAPSYSRASFDATQWPVSCSCDSGRERRARAVYACCPPESVAAVYQKTLLSDGFLGVAEKRTENRPSNDRPQFRNVRIENF